MNKLTPQEEEAMKAVWQLNGGFIKHVLDLLPRPHPPYTTFASTIKNLERKGFLKAEKTGNLLRYQPLVKMEDYKKRFMNDIVNDYFKNSYKELVSFFVKQKKLNASELKELIEMIENNKK